MRDDLYGLPQVVAPALLVYHLLVDSSCGDIVGPRGVDVGETLVMAQVEVGLVAVGGDVAFTVLIGIERSRVYVDVWVEFLYRHFIAP